MPTLNKLTCTILLPPTDTPLPEYKRKYLDSSVTVYVPVPEIPILQTAPAFNIQLRSEDEWLAPGLAMFVYIDGYYQCNRSKRTPLTGGSSALELRVRQKEEKLAGGGGGFVGREWRWVQLDVEQANGVSDSHKDPEDHIGKIEVVVLRCDAEQGMTEEPRAHTSAVKASAKAPSAKAPSAKAPSAKAPSAKAPSAGKPATAASEGLGGMFGLFDGAGEFGLDGTGDAIQDASPLWDPNEGVYRWPDGHIEEPHNLDGQGYDYPGIAIDQYGQPYNQRVPYYHTSTSRRPRADDQGRPINAALRYGATPAPPLGHGPQVMGFAPNGAAMAAQPNMMPQQQPQGQRAQGQRQWPKIIVGPDGQQYIDISDHQPAGQRQTHAPPQGQPQHASGDYSHLPQGITVYTDPTTGAQYAVQGNAQQQQIHQQQRGYQQHGLQPYQQAEPATEEYQKVDTEHQRSIIFELGHKFTKLLGHDYRLVAAAVPHVPFLQEHDLAKCGSDLLGELKRQLNYFLSGQRHFPNGEEIVPLVDPRDEDPDLKTPRKKRFAPSLTAAYDDTVQDLSWVNEAAGDELAGEHKEYRVKMREEDGKRKKRHDEKAKKKKKEIEKDNESQHGSHESSSQDHFSSGSQSNTDSWATTADSKKIQDNAEGAGGWGTMGSANADVVTTGNWATSGDQNDETNPADNNDAPWPDPDPPTDGQTEAQPIQSSRDQPPPSSHNSTHRSSSSHKPSHAYSHAHSLRTTTTSKTTNPHAAIQPYFDVLRPTAAPPKTKPPNQNQYQHPLPRTPYLYPPTQTPALPAPNPNNISHGVRAGKGAEYSHATRRPKYLDTMERPYAVFVFEYRSAAKLGEILGGGRREEGLRKDLERVEEEVGTGVLMGLPKEKLVEEILRGRLMAGAGGGEAGGGGGGGAGGEFASLPEQVQPLANVVDNWNTGQQQQQQQGQGQISWGAADIAGDKPNKTQSHGHDHDHGKSHKSESKSKSKSKSKETKQPSVVSNAWSQGGAGTTGQQNGAGGGWDDTAGGAVAGGKW